MELTEAYSYLFFDSVLAELIFPLQTQLVFPAMEIFGGYNPIFMIVITLVASVIGAMGNWYIGRLISMMKKWYGLEDPVPHSRVGRINTFFQKWGKWLMAACGFLPVFGSIVMIGLGFFKVRFRYIFLAYTPLKLALLLVLLF